MDRTIVYPSAVPLDSDILQPQQDAMIAIGYALQAHTGKNTVFVGLACAPTAPASMSVTVSPGAVIAPNVVETTPFGSISADTTDPLIKMGINIVSSSFTMTAPTVSGQSQNYLIQGTFSEADDTPSTLVYFNSLNPSQPYSGPANTGTPQNTRRAQRVNLLLKVGVPANTGSQITPSVDAGWSGLYVITVTYGQSAITSTSITTYPGAPFLSAFLSSHHGGVPGQAPQINLATEVQGVLSPANLPSALGSTLVYAGNPNGYVAGSAASGNTPPVLCWDTTDRQWWTCTSSGTAATAVWITPNIARQRLTTATTLYVSTSGNDTTGIGTTSAPFATIQGAYSWAVSNLDLCGFMLTISASAGTYGSVYISVQLTGQSSAVVITGAGSSTVIGGLSPSPSAFNVSGAAQLQLKNMSIVNGTYATGEYTSSGYGLGVTDGAVVSLAGNITFGTCGLFQIYTALGGIVSNATSGNAYYINGSALAFILADSFGFAGFVDCVITFTAAVSYSDATVYSAGRVDIAGTTWINPANVTGSRYIITSGGMVNTNGGGASFIPGTIAGSIATYTANGITGNLGFYT